MTLGEGACVDTTATPGPRPLQGLPLGSGMGSSAASAAAAAWAVNGLFGSPVSKDDLVLAGLASEAAVSGYHADNVGPSLLGGFVLVRWARRRLGGPPAAQRWRAAARWWRAVRGASWALRFRGGARAAEQAQARQSSPSTRADSCLSAGYALLWVFVAVA